MYGSETIIWKENEKFKIVVRSLRIVQMDNLKGLIGIRRMDKVQNAKIREVCGVTKRVNDCLEK